MGVQGPGRDVGVFGIDEHADRIGPDVGGMDLKAVGAQGLKEFTHHLFTVVERGSDAANFG